MKYALQVVLFFGMFFSSLLNACCEHAGIIEFTGSEVIIPGKLGNLKLYKDFQGFYIIKNSKIYDIQNCFCDPFLLKMSDDQLMKFLGRGKPKMVLITPEEFSQINFDDMVEITGAEADNILSQLFAGEGIVVNKLGDQYTLHVKIRGLGGGRVWRIFYGLGTGALIIASVVITAPVGAAFAGAAVMFTVIGAANPNAAGIADPVVPPAPANPDTHSEADWE